MLSLTGAMHRVRGKDEKGEGIGWLGTGVPFVCLYARMCGQGLFLNAIRYIYTELGGWSRTIMGL